MPKKTACTTDSTKVASPIKKKISADLIKAGMDGNRRFHATGQALAVIADILKTYDIEWDEVLDGFRFSRTSGRAQIRLAAQTDDIFGHGIEYGSINNPAQAPIRTAAANAGRFDPL